MRRDLYKDIADKEETHWWHRNKKALLQLLLKKESKFLTSNSKALDVGCGTGMLLNIMNKKMKAYGIDNQPLAIKFCKEKGLKNIKKGNSEELGFRSNQFDLITMFDVLEHTNEDKTIKEVNRILRKNGLVFITVPAYQWMWSKWDEILGHHKRYTSEELKALLQENGFKIKKLSYLYSFLLPVAYIVRKIKSISSKSGEYSSDFWTPPKLANEFLFNIAKFELSYFNNADIPFGLSVVAIAKKVK